MKRFVEKRRAGLCLLLTVVVVLCNVVDLCLAITLFLQKHKRQESTNLKENAFHLRMDMIE